MLDGTILYTHACEFRHWFYKKKCSSSTEFLSFLIKTNEAKNFISTQDSNKAIIYKKRKNNNLKTQDKQSDKKYIICTVMLLNNNYKGLHWMKYISGI